MSASIETRAMREIDGAQIDAEDFERVPLDMYEADAEMLAPPKEKAKERQIEAKPFQWKDPTAIPPRQWIYAKHYMRGMVSATAGIAGAGKSTLLNVELVSLAIGRDLLNGGREIALGPMTVWGHNGEDPYEELQRRILAVCQHYGVTRENLGDRLRITSGRDMPIMVARELTDGGKLLVPTEDGQDIAAELDKHRIQVFVADPFVTIHRVNENDNVQIDAVMTILRDIAHESQSAIEVAHHFRKLNGEEASVDAIRGAGALIGACRSVRIVSSMSRDEAAKYAIDDEQRGFYSWLQNGKANMLPPTHKRRWLFMVGVDLGNGTETHASDEIGVVTSWDPPDASNDLTPPEFRAVRLAIQSANPLQALRFDIRSKAWVGNLIARTLELDETDKIVRKQMQSIVNRFLKLGYVRKDEIRDPVAGRNTVAIVWQKGAEQE